MNLLIREAENILLNNRREGYTLPTNNKLYPAQWNWDSAYIALGYSYFNKEFAIVELEKLFEGQWSDGMVPHILFHQKDENYFPNHNTWQCGDKIPSSGITQPPIAASILKLMLDKTEFSSSEMERILNLIKKTKKYLEWFCKYRDPNDTGLVSILHPWESGTDNSPLWDFPLSKILVEENLAYKRRDLDVSSSDVRPLKRDYDCYITLLNQFRNQKYNPEQLYDISMFNVVDIGFNSLFLKACKDLVYIATKNNIDCTSIQKKITRTENKLISLYNQNDNSFYSYDVLNKQTLEIPSITNYFILFADIQNKEINNSIIQSLKKYNSNEKYFFSSIKPDSKYFEEIRYWRGPVWINCNWILYKGLLEKDPDFANKIKSHTLDLIHEKDFHEYYSCKSGTPYGANNFSWSAALYLDLINN